MTTKLVVIQQIVALINRTNLVRIVWGTASWALLVPEELLCYGETRFKTTAPKKFKRDVSAKGNDKIIRRRHIGDLVIEERNHKGSRLYDLLVS